MLRAILMAASLIVGNADNKTIVRSNIGTVIPGGGASSIMLSCPFSTIGAFASGSTTLCSILGSPVAINNVRASSATYYDANGVIQTATSNQLRVGKDLIFASGTVGVISEDTRTNVMLQSGKMNSGAATISPWLATSVTVSDGAAWPAGGGTMTRVASTGAGGSISQAGASGIVYQAAQVWVAAASGTQDVSLSVRAPACGFGATTVGCSRSDGAACTVAPGLDAAHDLNAWTTVGTTPVLFSIWGNFAGCNGAPTMILYPGRVSTTASNFGTADFAGADVEEATVNFSTVRPTAYIPTTSTAVQRVGDSITMATPASLGLAPGVWCVSLNAYAPILGTTTSGGDQVLFQWGTSFAGANTANLAGGTESGALAFSDGVFDATGNGRFVVGQVFAGGFGAFGWVHPGISAQTNEIFVNGVDYGNNITGIGTGSMSIVPAAISIGSDGAGSRQIDGWINSLLISPIARQNAGVCK